MIQYIFAIHLYPTVVEVLSEHSKRTKKEATQTKHHQPCTRYMVIPLPPCHFSFPL